MTEIPEPLHESYQPLSPRDDVRASVAGGYCVMMKKDETGKWMPHLILRPDEVSTLFSMLLKSLS